MGDRFYANIGCPQPFEEGKEPNDQALGVPGKKSLPHRQQKHVPTSVQ